MNTDHTPGPWIYENGNGTVRSACSDRPPIKDGESFQGLEANQFFDVCRLEWHSVYAYQKGGQNFPAREDVKRRVHQRYLSNARLICMAPDMDLLLSLLVTGKAQIRITGTLREIAFRSVLHPIPDDGDWSQLVHSLGRDRIIAALQPPARPPETLMESLLGIEEAAALRQRQENALKP